MTNKEFKGFVRLSSDQYAELKLNGSLVIEGRTIEYSPLDTIYMITDAGNMIDVANTTEGEPNDVVLNITNNILRAQLNQTIKTKINNKQDKLTAGTNITIDTNNVISANAGLTKVVATDVDSESATNGQVLTADGSGGASWQNASGGKLYRHSISIKLSSSVPSRSIYFTVLTTNNNTLTGELLYNLDLGVISCYVLNYLPTTTQNATYLNYKAIAFISSTRLTLYGDEIILDVANSRFNMTLKTNNENIYSITDTVTEL